MIKGSPRNLYKDTECYKNNHYKDEQGYCNCFVDEIDSTQLHCYFVKFKRRVEGERMHSRELKVEAFSFGRDSESERRVRSLRENSQVVALRSEYRGMIASRGLVSSNK